MAVPIPAGADVLHYRYDSIGRLTRVCNALPGDGERTDYSFDPANNRSSYTNTKTDIALWPGSSIFSPNGRFQFTMQGDGNLVLYRINPGQDRTGLWSTGTNGSGASVAYFQSDGNLVVYSPSQGVWHTATYMYPCAQLAVQNDGNVVIYTADGQPVWSTNTSGQ